MKLRVLGGDFLNLRELFMIVDILCDKLQNIFSKEFKISGR